MSVIHRIKNEIPIVDVLERYTDTAFTRVKMRKEKFNIRCPWHDDRSPSCTIYTKSNNFRCWAGCNSHRVGDQIDVVRLSQNVGTREAIKILVADYGVKKPDSVEAKEWQKKRASREQSAALMKGLNKKVSNSMDALKKVEKTARTSLSTIKKIEDMERIGDLYHVVTQIEYWLDCLVEDNPIVQFQTLQELSRFLEKINAKAR